MTFKVGDRVKLQLVPGGTPDVNWTRIVCEVVLPVHPDRDTHAQLQALGPRPDGFLGPFTWPIAYIVPALTVPSFTSLEEAQAWLDARSQGDTDAHTQR